MKKLSLICFAMLCMQNLEAKDWYSVNNSIKRWGGNISDYLSQKISPQYQEDSYQKTYPSKRIRTKDREIYSVDNNDREIYSGDNIVFPSETEVENFIENTMNEMKADDATTDNFVNIGGPVLEILKKIMTGQMNMMNKQSIVKSILSELNEYGIQIKVKRSINIHNFTAIFEIPNKFKITMVVKASKTSLKTTLEFTNTETRGTRRYYYDGTTNSFRREH